LNPEPVRFDVPVELVQPPDLVLGVAEGGQHPARGGEPADGELLPPGNRLDDALVGVDNRELMPLLGRVIPVDPGRAGGL